MKCVGYDVAFQRVVAERYAQWEPEQGKAGSKREKERKDRLDLGTLDDEGCPPPIKSRKLPPSFYEEIDDLSDLSDLTDIE